MDVVMKTCADAVLRLLDGTDIPCSKFTMMAACSVLRVMTELETFRDEPGPGSSSGPGASSGPGPSSGPYVIPVGDVGTRKYEVFCDAVHGVKDIRTLTFDEAMHVRECSRRLGAPDVERSSLVRAWELTTDLRDVPDLIQDFFRYPEISSKMIVESFRQFPLWRHLVRHVLAHVVPDDSTIPALLAYQNEYPPAAIAKWMLTADENVMTPHAALVIATSNAHLYAPDEIRPVYKTFVRLCTPRGWNVAAVRMAIATLEATACVVPVPRTMVRGTLVEYDDVPRTIVAVTFSGTSKKRAIDARLVRIDVPRDDEPISFRIRGEFPGDVRVRVSVSRSTSMYDPMYEAIHVIPRIVHQGNVWVPCGDAAFSEGCVHRTDGNIVVRLDIRY